MNSGEAQTIIAVQDLVKHFPLRRGQGLVHAVNRVSLRIQHGETLGLVGESGSGKTTVGRCIARLLEPTSGDLTFMGRDLQHLDRRGARELRARIRIVFQEPHDSFDPRRTVGDTLGESVAAFAPSGASLAARVNELGEMVSLTRVQLHKYPHELSAGQVQAAGVARAMATSPDLVVLDEPTSLLDASARAHIVGLLKQLQLETGVAYLFISHDLAAVQHLSHRVAIMYLGQVCESAPTDEIFAHALHPYTRALLASVLRPDPDHKRPRFGVSGEIPSPIRLPSGCSLHTRCPIAVPVCSETNVRLVEARPGHWASCLRTAPTAEYGAVADAAMTEASLAEVAAA